MADRRRPAPLAAKPKPDAQGVAPKVGFLGAALTSGQPRLRLEKVIGTSENSPRQSQATSPPNKACPVVIRGQSAFEVLAFVHPLAGFQLVKGTIEPGENSRDAALRELREKSGLSASKTSTDLGTWVSGYENQIWTFHLRDIDGLSDSWTFRTTDDGGHDFKFFWHPLLQQPIEQWHWVFQGALKCIASKLPARHG